MNCSWMEIDCVAPPSASRMMKNTGRLVCSFLAPLSMTPNVLALRSSNWLGVALQPQTHKRDIMKKRRIGVLRLSPKQMARDKL